MTPCLTPCAATGCEKPILGKLVMCGRHWVLVPPELQKAMMRRLDQPGHADYVRAARQAVAAVAEKEGRAG